MATILLFLFTTLFCIVMMADSIEQISITTLNTKGLRNKQKRLQIFQACLDTNADIYFLQETHSSPQDTHTWQSEWERLGGGRMFFSHSPTPHLSGTATLLAEHFHTPIQQPITDVQGRYVILPMTINGQKYQLTNVYGPTITQDKAPFYNQIYHLLDPAAQAIVGGDFNMVLDNSRDRKTPKHLPRHNAGQNELTNILQQFDLHDSWRAAHPQKVEYTFASATIPHSNNTPRSKARLDRIYTHTNKYQNRQTLIHRTNRPQGMHYKINPIPRLPSWTRSVDLPIHPVRR